MKQTSIINILINDSNLYLEKKNNSIFIYKLMCDSNL